jgi:hypothetical protein
MEVIKKVLCPLESYDCPYFKLLDGSCSMFPQYDPADECDDFFYYHTDADFVMGEVEV